LDRLPPGTLVALDGSNGIVWVDPPSQIQSDLKANREKWIAQRHRLLETSHEPARTRDGQRVEVFANVGNIMDAKAAIQNGAEGVGLLRTEFLFLTRETPPSEAEQMAALRQIGETLGDRPVTVRTLDVGGDKEVPYIKLPAEANPFLGVRAIRMSLNHPDLFMTQLRAILRAGEGYRFRIMFPMVANLEEIRQARGWLEKAHLALQAENLAHAWPVETGIMVEIPAAALLSSQLARAVDFFSIGTNDLTQYTMAAERGNPLLTGLADALHPAVLRLIGEVAAAAHAEGKWVAVCGELAGDPQAAAILVGLGVDELSLNPVGIPRIKAILHSITMPDAKALAAQALESESAPAVRELAGVFFQEHQRD
jgi:phosphocarrier protein FPr